MINKRYNKHSISLKSLLVIIGLQLVILQVQALTMSFDMSQQPCNHSLMVGGMEHDSSSEVSSGTCWHCEEANLDCYNSCYTSSLVSHVCSAGANLEKFHSVYYLEKNKPLLAVSQPPKLRPPQ